MAKKFVYKEKSADSVKKRQVQGQGDYDKYINPQFPILNTKEEGSYTLRILPDTWEGADSYGFKIQLHYGVGPDNQTYVCREAMGEGPCPICEERRKADRDGDEEYAKQLKAKDRVLYWVINRDKPEDGPMVYPAPITVDRDLSVQSVHPRTNKILAIDHPEDGYDVFITKSGKGLRTTYNVQIDREPTPLSDDEGEMEDWLDYICENPLPDTVQVYDYDRVMEVFGGVPDDSGMADRTTNRTKAAKAGNIDLDDEIPTEDEDDTQEEEDSASVASSVSSRLNRRRGAAR